MCGSASMIGAGAAVVGAGVSVAGALGGGTGTPGQYTSQNTLPSWLSTPEQANVGTAQSLAQTPYNPAMNYQVAGFNPQQTQAFQGISNLQGQYQQPYNTALSNTQQLGNQAAQGLNNSQFQSYMNPYIQQVNQASNAQSFQNLGIAQNQLGEQAAGSGAFGNSRLGLAQGQLTSNALMNMNAQNASNLAGGFNTALGGYQTGINQGLNAAGQMGSLATNQQNTGLQGLSALQGAGATQQQYAQQQMTATQQNALQQAQYPWQQLANAQNIMTPMQGPYQQSSGTQIGQQPSTASQIGSTLNGLAGSGAISGLANGYNTYTNYNPTSLNSGIVNYQNSQMASNPTGSMSNQAWADAYSQRTGGVVPGYAKGGGVSVNTMPGSPAFFHMLQRDTPHFEHGHAGFRKGGAVDPSTLTQGMRSGGLLHKATKGAKGSKVKMASPKALAGLQALAQQYGMQGGPAGSTPYQGLPSPSMGAIAAPGAQQPQIGLMSGGMVPSSINGYASGGVPMKREYGINGCYADGGSVDPISQALTNPGNNYSLGDIIQEQRANNYVNQLLGQGQGGLPQGYRTGGIVGYDDGGGVMDYLSSLGDPSTAWDAMTGKGVSPTGYQFQTSQPTNTPLQNAGAWASNAGQMLNPMRAVGSADNFLQGINSGAISNYLNTPENVTAAQAKMPQNAAQAQAVFNNIKAQRAKSQAPISNGSVSAEDEAYIDNLQKTAFNNANPQQAQGPIGPYGTPMNLPALAMSSGMLAGYAGHGNAAADMAAGYGSMEQQAMQQRQNDAMMAYRSSIMGLNQAKAQSDIGNLNIKQQMAPLQQQYKQAQTQEMLQQPQLHAQQIMTTRAGQIQQTIPGMQMTPMQAMAEAQKEFMSDPQGAAQKAIMGNTQQQGFGSNPGFGGMSLQQLQAMRAQMAGQQ